MGILSNLNIKRMQDDPSSSDVNFVSDHGYCRSEERRVGKEC